MRRLTAKLLPAALPALLAAAWLAAATPARGCGGGGAGTGFTAAAAPDGPGAPSYLDLGRKDCLGTARNTASKVWYTVAGGVLSDVYYPTTDNTNVKTVQYIVTDGRTFTDLQTRDMTYTVRPLDGTGMACQVTSTAKSGAYRLVTDYITDPLRDSVVMHTTYVPLTPQARGYHLYVRYNALINGTGGGGSPNGGGGSATVDPATTGLVSYNTSTASSYAPRDYEVPVYGTLAASQRFPVASSGFAGGPSDGLTQLDSSHALTATYQNAVDGNVVQTAEINTSRSDQFTLALGYAQTRAQSIRTAQLSAATPFAATYARYRVGWLRYDAGLSDAARPLPRGERSREPQAGRPVLGIGQRDQGHRRQGVPRRHRVLPRRPVGPGHHRQLRHQRPGGRGHQLPGDLRAGLL